ncbi:hypothetical protein ABL78_8195 [Leptomonas seymouri]|uniref:Uncharacterized protein n=1 Tax=Leptomonas seymouri TaxID=5684 RepID=A0A0N1HYH7_LEPSE|nr:hypothetical protein ABL78_8195 [Leptomonas seymouri]|eukprot:KPI82792.1 hypothetical protein ABL78_8195 [Leptomonas seymouri]
MVVTAPPIAPHGSEMQTASAPQLSLQSCQERQDARGDRHNAAGAATPSPQLYQQQQRIQAYRHHSHQHHHRQSHRQSQLHLRSPNQQHQQFSSNHNDHNSHRRSPPSYTEITLMPAPATGSATTVVLPYGVGGSPATPACSPPSSPPGLLQPPLPHGRYRSSLPVPPPLRSLPASTVPQSCTVSANENDQRGDATAQTPVRRPQAPQLQQQRCAEPSRRPEPRASLRIGLPPPPPPLSVPLIHRHSCRSAHVMKAGYGTLNAHQLCTQSFYDTPANPPEDEKESEGLSTPTDQRVPAMLPPSYDVYNLGGPAHGVAAAYRGAHSRRSRHTCGADMEAERTAAGDAALTRFQRCASSSLKSPLHSVALAQKLASTELRATTQREGPSDESNALSASQLASEVPTSHQQHAHHEIDTAAVRRNADGAGAAVGDRYSSQVGSPRCLSAPRVTSTTSNPARQTGGGHGAKQADAATPCHAASRGCCSPTCRDGLRQSHPHSCHHRCSRHHTLVGLAYGTVSPSNGRVLCEMTMSASAWRLAEHSAPAEELTTWRPNVSSTHPYLLGHRRSNSRGSNAGTSGASEVVRHSTPSSAPVATQARTTPVNQQLHLTSAEDASAMYGQCSTPRELCLPLSSSPAAAAVSPFYRGSTHGAEGLVTPDVLPGSRRPSTPTVAISWDAVAVPSPAEAPRSGDDHHPTVCLHDLHNESFLFSVEERERSSTVEAAGPAAPTPLLRSPPSMSASTYCSPQQLCGSSRWQPPLMSSAAMTPPAATSTPSTEKWQEALFTSPMQAQAIASATAGSAGGDWRSPQQWNPRQARDDTEMLEAKEVAHFAVAHHRSTAAAAAAAASTPCSSPPLNGRSHTDWCSGAAPQCASSREPSLASVDVPRTAPCALPCILPLCKGWAISTGDLESASDAYHALSHQQEQQQQQRLMKEEVEAEWVELLLYYRDRENEISRARRALEVATAPPSASATAAMPAGATLPWWATSSLMRNGFSPPRREHTQPQQQPDGATSLPSPPPASLRAAMSAPTAGRTLAHQVRRQLLLQRGADRSHKWAYTAARLPVYTSRRLDGRR